MVSSAKVAVVLWISFNIYCSLITAKNIHMASPSSINGNIRFSPMFSHGANRCLNTSASERSLLLGVISTHLSVLDARDNDNRSLRQKSQLWERITHQFNSLSPTPRSKHQIQTLYKNMKAKAKKYQQRLVEAHMDNFVSVLPEPDPVSELLLQLLESEHEQRRQQMKQAALFIAEGLSNTTTQEEVEEQKDFGTQLMCEPVIGKTEDDGSFISVKNEEGETPEHSREKSSSYPEDNSSNLSETLNVSEDSKSSYTEEESAHADNSHGSKRLKTIDLSRLAQSDLNGVSQNLTTQLGVTQNLTPFNSVSTNLIPLNGVSQNLTPINGVPQNLTPSNSVPQNLSSLNEMSQNLNFPNGVPQTRSSNFDYENYLKFADSHLPTFAKSSRQCCCPHLHAELFSLAKTEHEQRMKSYEEEQKRTEELHKEKKKLIELEAQICNKKLELIRNLINNVDNLKDPKITTLSFINSLGNLSNGEVMKE